MAQATSRPARHSRQPSRIATLLRRNNNVESETETSTIKLSVQDDATINYIKRTLCARTAGSGPDSNEIVTKPLDELLPPLTSSNAVDVQLYALIAVILNQFVQTWYNKITPDQEFVSEIVQIIAHCTRGVEQRFRKVHLEALLLDELPNLVAAHIEVVRIARSTSESGTTETKHGVSMVFNTMRPHIALTPPPMDAGSVAAQRDSESAWSQMVVDRVLPLLLPPEDLENPCLHVLVSDIFADMVLQNGVCGKTCESWLIWEGVTKVIHLLRPDTSRPMAADSSSSPSPASRLEQFGLLSTGAGAGAGATAPSKDAAPARPVEWVAQGFWSALQYAAVAWSFLRAIVTALMHASSIPHRAGAATPTKSPMADEAASFTNNRVSAPAASGGPAEQSGGPRPIVCMSIWYCTSLVLSLQRRMPWLTGLLSLLQWLSLHGPGRLCDTNRALDRLMASHFRSAVLDNATLLPSILQAARTTLFPGYTLAPPRAIPTPDESLEIKRACARAALAAVPEPVRTRFFAMRDESLMLHDIEGSMLDLFADEYINKHLVIDIVELLALRLFPELAE